MTNTGHIFATILLTTSFNLLDGISASTLTNHHIQKQKYDSNCICQINWFDHAGIPYLIFQPEHMNIFGSFDAVLWEACQPLEEYWVNNRLLPANGMCTRQWHPENKDASTLMTQCLDFNRPAIQEHTPGFLVIWWNPVNLRNITLQELTQPRDMLQSHQLQQNWWESQ